MDRLLRILGLLGIVDGVLLALSPRVWSRWRTRWTRGIGERPTLARLVAAVELTIGLYLLLRLRSKAGEEPQSVPPPASSVSLKNDRVFVPWTLSRPLLVAFRLPVYLYRLGLGWLLGHRFLMLSHSGRRSGRLYQTVLEVVHYDPRTRESVVVSGWGRRADWYRNIQAHPPLEVRTGGERYVPVYRELSPGEAYPVLVDYVRRLPAFARPVIRRLFAGWGFAVEGPEEVQRAQAASLLMLAFRPQSEAGRGAGQTSGRGARYSDEPEDKRAYTRAVNRSYTRWAALYDVAVKLIPLWRRWLRHALPHLRGPRVLEVSFGTGDLLTQYANQYEAHGVDLNWRMVQVARRNLAKSGMVAHLVQANVEALPYPDGAFDSVLNTMAFSGYPDARLALEELVRVLKPGGRLVLIDVSYPADGNWLGTRLIDLWKQTGDLIRDMGALFREFGLEFTDTAVGGWGSVHLYVAVKPDVQRVPASPESGGR